MQGARSSRILRWTLVVSIGLGVLGLIAIAAFLVSDCEPPDDRDLIWVPQAIPDEENGFLPLVGMDNRDWPKEKRLELECLLDGPVMDLMKARQMLHEGQKFLDIFHATILHPSFLVSKPSQCWLEPPDIVPVFYLGRLAALEAQVLFQEEKEQAAFHLALDIIRLGHQFPCGPLITRVSVHRLKEAGAARIRGFLKDTRLDANALIAFTERLSSDVDESAGYIESCRVDYTLAAADVDRLAAGEIHHDWRLQSIFFKGNKTKRRMAEWYSRHIRNAPLPYGQMELEERKTGWDLPRLDALTNYLGEIWFSQSECWLRVMCQTRASLQATRLLLALKAYHMERGCLPATLDELPPHYIDAVPADPFDGRPMRYSAGRKVVWSIGADLVDSAGNGKPEDRNEPSFPIEWR